MSLSNYLENELIDHLFRARSFTAPAAIWISLHTADPGETGANEMPSTNGYARVQYNPSGTNWKGTGGETTAVDSAGTGGQTKNAVAINFAQVNTGDWSQATHFGLWSLQTGGNFFIGGALGTPITFVVGDVPTIPIDGLVVTLD